MAESRAGRAARWLAAGDLAVGLAMAALVVYYVATRGVFQGKASGDGWFGFQYLNAIVHHRTLDMQIVLRQWLPYFGLDPVTHHMPNRCPFGPVLVWMPFYLVADAIAAVARLFGQTATPDSPLHAWVAGLGSLSATLLGWRAVHQLLARRVSREAARVGSIAAVWATPLAWYAVTQPLYQHAAAFLFVALFIERWDATLGRSDWRRFVLLGVLGGMAMEMRAQEVLWLLLPAAECAWRVVRGPERRRFFVGGLVFGASALVAFLPQLLVWRYYTATWQGPQLEPLRLGTPMPIVTLFSTRSGLLPWSPIVYAAALGWALARKARGLTLALLGVFAVELYIVSCAWVPSGAYSYGARRLSDAAPLFGLGVALLYDHAAERTWARRAVLAFTGLCVALCLLTMELQRQRKVPSSGGSSRSAERYLREVGAPSWLQRVFARVGYPFVQPVGWLFAAWYRVPVATFEGVVGTFFLDREGQWYTVLTKSLALDQDDAAFVIDGLALESAASRKPATVTGPVRLMLPMFARERVGVKVSGKFAPGPLGATWNGTAVPVKLDGDAVAFDVPAAQVRVGVNDLRLVVPVGSKAAKLDFTSYDQWWVKK